MAKTATASSSSSAKLSFSELVTIVWFVLDAFTHLSIEAAYCWIALHDTAQYTDNYFGHIWREYGRADHRWAVRDPNVISLEILTAAVVGPLCALQIYGIYHRCSWRHLTQVVICTCELYGGWMTFAPEWIEGSPNLDGSTFTLLWIYLVFMNGLWVLVPALLLVDSGAFLVQATSVADRLATTGKDKDGDASYAWFYKLIAVSLVLYMILVPGVLSQAEGVPVSVKQA